jgi:hypothetical protein
MRLQAPETSDPINIRCCGGRRARFFAALPLAAGASLVCSLGLVVGCGGGITTETQPQSQPQAIPAASAKGPQLGYLWIAADHTLRPILGVPGSSQVGQSVVPAGVYSGAASSPTASIAILQDSGGAFDLIALPSGSPTSLGVTLPVGARIRLSPSAAAALLYTPGAASASLITGLLSTPQVKAVSAPGAIADSAVSDTGAVGLEYTQGAGLALSVVAADGHSAAIGMVKAPGGLNFLPASDDVLFADSAANSLTLVRSTTSAPAASAIPSQLLNAPTAVGVSGSGRWALVVNKAPVSSSQTASTSSAASSTLVRVDLTSLAITPVSCACTATLAATLADDGAFRITDASTGPNWMIDAAPSTPRTLFIPALPASAKTTLVASGVVP